MKVSRNPRVKHTFTNFFDFNEKQKAQSDSNNFRQGGTEMIYWTHNNWFWRRNPFLREKVVDGDPDGKIEAKVLKKTKDSFGSKSCSSMKASIQNRIQEVRAVVFGNDELDFGEVSELKAFLPLLAYQDSNSDVEIIF